MSLPCDRPEWDEWFGRGFSIEDVVPKGYFGPPNLLEQLHSYIVGWEAPEAGRWSEVEAAFKRVDYPSLISSFSVTNPNAFGGRHPFDFF